jgi:hypothetical protein
VAEFEHFEFFLDSSGLDKVRLGFYEKKPNKWAAPGNYVVYEIPDDEDTKHTATMITLQYGSIEDAFKDFRDEIEKKILSSTISYGY